MNPKPFASLNHLTTPVVRICALLPVLLVIVGVSGRAVPTDENVTNSRKPAPARACEQINDEGPERMSQVPRAPPLVARV